MLHTLYHALAWLWGGDGQGGAEGDGYLITSGPLASSAVVGAVVVWLYRSRCEERRCWRHARHHDRGGNNVCRKHYELGLPTDAFDAINEVRDSQG